MAEFDLDYKLIDAKRKVYCPSCNTEILADDIPLKELMFDENVELEEDYTENTFSSYVEVEEVAEDNYDDL
ncbi:MAG: hypothetical protein ABIH89_06185 [Elusimicrobiota bacterium]